MPPFRYCICACRPAPALPNGTGSGLALGFPSGKALDSWRAEDSSIPGPTQQALITLEWVHWRENLAVCGPSGTGKSQWCEALLVAVHQEFQCPSAWSPLSAYLESGVSAVTPTASDHEVRGSSPLAGTISQAVPDAA